MAGTAEPWQLPSFAALVDRPAREALLRARGSASAWLSPALVGLALMTITTTIGALLGGPRTLVEPELRALFEALVLAVPLTLVVTTFALPSLSPTSTAAIVAISLCVAGLCASLTLPLNAFLWLCSRDKTIVAHAAQLAEVLLAPAVFLLATSVVLSRALETFGHRRGEVLAWLFGCVAFAVFLMRVAPVIRKGW